MPSLSKIGLINICISALAAVATYIVLALIARQFGGSSGSDAYFFLFSLVTICTALVGSVLSAVFQPAFIDLRVRGSLDQAIDFGSAIFSWLLIICLSTSLITYLLHDHFFEIVSKFDRVKLERQKNILICFGPVLFFSVAGEYLRLLLIGLGRYIAAALCIVLAPAVLLLTFALPSQLLSEELLALSLLVARSSVLLYALLAVKRAQVKLRFTLLKTAAIKGFLTTSAPYASASLVTHFATFFFDYLATGLSAGVLTSVAYAQRIFALPIALVVTPILDIAKAKFSEYRAKDDITSFQMQYERLSKITLYFAMPVAVVFYLYAEQIVSILFQRGAFTAKDAAVSANCLKILAFSIPLTCYFTLNGRTVESFQKLLWPSIFGTVGNLGLIMLTFNFVDIWGYLGIPYAKLAIDLFYFLPFGVIAVISFGIRINTNQLLQTLLVACASCAISFLCIAFFSSHSSSWDADSQLACNALKIVVFFLIYSASLLLLDRSMLRIFMRPSHS